MQTQTSLTQYKMKLAAICKKIKTSNSRRNRFKKNQEFKKNQKMFYSNLRNGTVSSGVSNPPKEEDVKSFWENLYKRRDHNEKATWLEEEEKEMKRKEKAIWEDITSDDITSTSKKLSNWKGPGLDQVHNFWLKHLTSLHPQLSKGYNFIVKNPQLAPEWLTRGRTTLIHKKGPTEEARNYRPITCLPTYYKFITLILTDKIYKHVCDNDILPFEQKGIRRKSRGCKDHLLLDKFICEEAKRKKRNLSMMWIDYKKAYDSVPHSWIKELM